MNIHKLWVILLFLLIAFLVWWKVDSVNYDNDLLEDYNMEIENVSYINNG